MPESGLLTQILSDYCAANGLDLESNPRLSEFCSYAAAWLVDNSCLGLGHSPTGLSLRFADGRELSLFSAESAAALAAPAVAISTVRDKLVTKTMADTNPDFQITGRVN